MKTADPMIRVSAALDAFDGVQARLAGVLGLSRASVNDWVKSGREFLPSLQAHRLAALMPELVESDLDERKQGVA